MTLDAIRERLRAVPDVDVPHSPRQLAAIDQLVTNLGSDAALESLGYDTYWPKWSSPWWHMLLLWELGFASRIPHRTARAMVEALNALPLHIFPILPNEWPPNSNRSRDTSCHCALGCMDQVLTACGIDVDAELPWIRPWFIRYQMTDGGLNCDEEAYLVKDECPSSMVGTVPAIEAMTRRGPSDFLKRGTAFLIDRELVRGSSTRHNADEQLAAVSWMDLTFPRFYFYDVLRGLTALVKCSATVPAHAVARAVDHLLAVAPDGIVRVGRNAHAGKGTHVRDSDGTWRRDPIASTFPLLDEVCEIGAPSSRLTAEWRSTRHALLEQLSA